MAAGHSAGVLLYRRSGAEPEVLLIHPGGPFWRKRDAGAWQIPKGGIEEGEAPFEAARREAEEELGIALAGTPWPLARVRQSGGKVVDAFALEQDIDCTQVASNLFELEWPPRSGAFKSFPEVDRAAWFTFDAARAMILPSQTPLLDALERTLVER